MYSNDRVRAGPERQSRVQRRAWRSWTRRARYLRSAALVVALFGLIRLFLPVRGVARSFAGGWMDCGIAIRTIFRDSVYVCHQYAMGRLYEALFFLFLAALLLFASGIRRKLFLLGSLIVVASLVLLLIPPLADGGLLNPCRPAAFYLIARDPLFSSSEAPSVDLACNAHLTNHLLIMSAIASAGLVMLAVDASRQKRRTKSPALTG